MLLRLKLFVDIMPCVDMEPYIMNTYKVKVSISQKKSATGNAKVK